MATSREVLDWVEERTELDVVAITDHDDVAGAHRAREVWAKGKYRFDFIPGVEITTIEGHLLGLFVEDSVPNLCCVEEAVEAVVNQGGLCIAPHPLNWLTRSLGVRELRRLASPNDRPGLDGIELANCSPGSRLRRATAASLNREELGLAEIGGSDAHFVDFIGGAYTEFKGNNADDLKRAIAARATRARQGPRPALWDIGPRRLAQQAYRGIMTTPRRMGWGPTARSFMRRVFP
jgi:predicted metal-dependent phosphoesterase TrpH